MEDTIRILLVMPPPFETGRLGLENVVWLSEPVALTSIAGGVSDQHEVRILDMRLEAEDALAKALVAFAPDLVGTTSMTTDAYQAKAVLRMARQIRPQALTVVGGHHPTLMPQEFEEPYIDVVVQGEGETTFRTLVERLAEGRRDFSGVDGTRWRDASGRRVLEEKRSQATSLDTLPAPDRRLIKQYSSRYFFTAARNMASIFTSRGCSYDCNFCAIWEYYERKVRYLSAEVIADRMAACEEPFVFLLDDNFLVNKRRLVRLCEELERRGIKKRWLTQGRTDFVAANPELMARLAKNGLIMLLSGYESNHDDALAALRKSATWDANLKANEILAELGIFSTGIFMVRPDWTKEQFQGLYDYILSLKVGLPMVTILTPLPGTQLYRELAEQLLTNDHRLFDLLHAVLPTRLPREEFYAEFARSVVTLVPSARAAIRGFVRHHPELAVKMLPGVAWYFARLFRYRRVHGDPSTFLRDEQGLLNGPGSRSGRRWDEVRYPDAEALPEAGDRSAGRRSARLWSDDLDDARAAK